MDDTTLLVQIPDAVCDLEDDMSREILAKVCQLDNLMEQFATLADFNHRRQKTPVNDI
jgi:hypothetical protein